MRRVPFRTHLAGPVVLCAFLAGAGCVSPLGFRSGKDRTEVTGQVVEGRYVAPDNAFSMAVPASLARPGADISDQVSDRGGTVTFKDLVGTLVRLDFIRLRPEEVESLSGITERSFLTQITAYNARVFGEAVPGSQLVMKEFIEDGGDLVDFSLYDLPQGGTLVNRETRRPYDAKRGLLSFKRGDTVYILTAQHLHMFLSREQESAELIGRSLKEQLLKLKATITFAGE